MQINIQTGDSVALNLFSSEGKYARTFVSELISRGYTINKMHQANTGSVYGSAVCGSTSISFRIADHGPWGGRLRTGINWQLESHKDLSINCNSKINVYNLL